ncbi:MAG: alpha/beta hydrolase [Maritimibacter sp.]|nr:alpha/beta hydrolase [Maritimibacter sp.]
MSVRLNLLILASRLLVRPVALRADPIKLRADFERGAVALLRCPPYTCLTPTRFAPGLSGLAIRSRPGSRPPHPGRVMLWFHGGAFVAGSPRTHAGLLARLARMGRLEVVAPAYRLAPEHPFPAAVEDARTAFDGLVARGYAPGNIVIGGDSAGGNFALGLLAGLLGDGVRPAGVVALSPVTDLTFSGASIAANAVRDPMLPAARRGDVDRYYLVGADPSDPRASPLFAAFPDPPPVFLQVGSTEILRDDSVRMAEVLRAAGGRVVLDEWEGAPHVFTLLDGWLPEAREGLRRVAGFIDGLWAEAV